MLSKNKKKTLTAVKMQFIDAMYCGMVLSSRTGQTDDQGWDKYCPAGKFQWKMPEIAGMANTPKITEVANTGIYEQN